MANDPPERKGVYELLPPTAEPAEAQAAAQPAASLPAPLLLRNVLWFCRLRWAVVAILIAFGVLGFFPAIFSPLGLSLRPSWPFAVAGVLVLCNLAFLAHARLLTRNVTRHAAATNLWSQIVLDLVVLTVVVHFVGSVETYAGFAYLFHIVLACIFFSRAQGLAVTVLASALFVACVAAEAGGLIPQASIYAEQAGGPRAEPGSARLVLSVVSAIAIWTVVWYLAAQLAAMVRERDARLARTNRRLIAAQKERTRHMLYTTHELKAPFAAIHANAQLLAKGYCGELPDAAVDVTGRIARRCERLARMIQEMLQLANLRSAADDAPSAEAVDLRLLLEGCIERVRPTAAEQNITIESDLEAARVTGVKEQLQMLFFNVILNAVSYSYKEGAVQVRCVAGEDGPPLVAISDQGIGIPAEKLPCIFDEYYRTNEAAAHNSRSTGLGLAIVRHIAAEHDMTVRVESEPGAGTRFVLAFQNILGKDRKEE